MDELIKQGQWWWVLVVPVASGCFALFGSWWGSRLGKDTEHAQWLRNQKLDKYITYANACKYIISFRNSITNDEAKFDESVATLDMIDAELVASKPVQIKLRTFREAFYSYVRSPSMPADEGLKAHTERFSEATEALKSAFRKDLKIRD